MQREGTLAERLGVTFHESPLRRKLRSLFVMHPSPGAENLEQWLIDVANSRGARIVQRDEAAVRALDAPSSEVLSNEELVTGLMLLDSADRPQILRLAAQLISREAVESRALLLVVERERCGVVLAELGRQAIRADPGHGLWRELLLHLQDQPRPRSAILHWTRLAEPVMRGGRINADEWRLVS